MDIPGFGRLTRHLVLAVALIGVVPTLLASVSPITGTVAAQSAGLGGWQLVGDGDGPAARSDHTIVAD